MSKQATHMVRVSPELIAQGLSTWERAKHLRITSDLPPDVEVIGITVHPPAMGANGHAVGDVEVMFHSPSAPEQTIPRTVIPLVHDLGGQRPLVICFCGSTRFIEHMAVLAWEQEKLGRITLGPNLLPAGYDAPPSHAAEAEGVKEILDRTHLRKIDMADQVTVINIGGYIGDSTAAEIAYAEATGKPVTYTETNDGRTHLDADSQARLEEARKHA